MNIKDEASDSYTSYYARGSLMHSASAATSASSKSYHNFVSFLATAQMREVDFLPITWEPLLELVGVGGTAKISQSFLNLQLSYVFKRIRRDTLPPADECNAFCALTSEVLTLGHPEVRGHPNILRLVGICWDIVPRTKTVWPVLVFQKSKYGDLGQFMGSGLGRQMDFKGRLRLCTDIAAAIVLMHSHSIVHGDIKPQNVLVFPDDEGEIVAKVCDFGYSTLSARNSEEQQIHLPISTPWNAPEVDRNARFSLHQAKLADVYSFGVLCLWLLLTDATPQNTMHIGKLKEDGELEQFVRGRIGDMPSLGTDQKNGLTSFFACALARDASLRSLDLKRIMEPVVQFEVPPLPNNGFSTYEMWIPYLKWIPHHKDFDPSATQSAYYAASDSNAAYNSSMAYSNPYVAAAEADQSLISDFQLAKSFSQLIKSDYRLWEHLFKCLEDQASHSADEHYRENASFQTAFCYEVGFGTPKDAAKASYWLKRSRKTSKDLEKEVEFVKAGKHPLINKNLETEVQALDYEDYYRRFEVLTNAQHVYHSAVDDVEQTFGEGHPISIYLNSVLGQILCGQRDYERAHAVLAKTAKTCEESLGRKHPNTLTSLSHLALAYSHQGQLKEAEELQIEVMTRRGERVKAEDPSMLASMANLATTHIKQERWKEAEELEVQIMNANIKTLGADHPTTLGTMAVLVSVYLKQERWKEAEELGIQVMNTTSRIFGPEHSDVLADMDNMASCYKGQKRWREAEELEVQTLDIRKRTLGSEHLDTLTNMIDLATTYMEQERLQEAAELQTEAVDMAKKVSGTAHSNTLVAMHNLAFIWKKQNRDTEAINLMEETRRLREETLGPSHPLTISSAEALRVFEMLAKGTKLGVSIAVDESSNMKE